MAKRQRRRLRRVRALAHVAAMHGDVSYLAALIAGLVSFLSPCVLPLVPPYLVYLAGTSLERFADREPAPQVKRETVHRGGAVRARLFHRVRVTRRQRQRHRLADPRLFGTAGDDRRRSDRHHGPAFSWPHADLAADAAEAAGSGQARRACEAPM